MRTLAKNQIVLYCHFSSRKRNELASRRVQTKSCCNQLIQGRLKIWTEHSILPITWFGLDLDYDLWRLYTALGILNEYRKQEFFLTLIILMQFSWWINNLKIIISFSKPYHVRCSKKFWPVFCRYLKMSLSYPTKKIMKYITISMSAQSR